MQKAPLLALISFIFAAIPLLALQISAKETPTACSAESGAACSPTVGGESDAHGCKPSTGYVWNDELASCARPWISSAITIELSQRASQCKPDSQVVKTANGTNANHATKTTTKALCWQVRERSAKNKVTGWKPLTGKIEGFEPAQAKRYSLRVRKDLSEEEGVNSKSVRYTLLKILP